MTLPTPVPGLVISYAYLWRDEEHRGVQEGRKDRPCAIVLAVRDADGDTLVYVAPITHSEPRGEGAIEIPAGVKRRLGLDARKSWIVTDELNRFIWPGFDLRPISRASPDVFHWGFLPVELFSALLRAIVDRRNKGGLVTVDRD